MRAFRFATVVIAATLIGLWPASAASAHDGLTDSTPAAGETVTTALTAVTLTFSEVPLEGAPAVIQVTDATGESIAQGEVTASDRSLSVAVAPVATGEHTVVWQVVSSDAHTISGEYTFTYSGPVAAPSPSASTTEPSTEPSPSASSASPDPEPSATESAPSAVDTAGSNVSAGAFLPLIIAVLAAVVIAVVAAIWRANVKRDTSRDADRREGGDAPPRD